jgi:hypothetical protein
MLAAGEGKMVTKKASLTTKAIQNDPHKSIRVFSQKIVDGVLNFSSENLASAENCYVGWLDLMGAGHIMGTSVHKSANFLVRLHMAVEHAKMQSGFDLKTLPINDGIFIISPEKGPLITVIRHAMILLAARFIATPRQHDKCLMKGGIAFGPVYAGEKLRSGILVKSFARGLNIWNACGSALLSFKLIGSNLQHRHTGWLYMSQREHSLR